MKLLGRRSGGFLRLLIVSEFAFPLFQFKQWIPYDFWFLDRGRSGFKLVHVDGYEKQPSLSMFYLILEKEMMKYLSHLTLMTSYCKDVQILSFISQCADMDTFCRESRAINEDLQVVYFSMSKRPQRDAFESLASTGTTAAYPYDAPIPHVPPP
jgi:hypothetical protein